MVAPFGQTHPIRIYRGSVDLGHDLNAVLALEDIYGEDKMAVFTESDAEYVTAVAEVGLSQHPALLIVDNETDLDEGYYIEVKKPMRLNGSWVPVETTTSGGVSPGDTEIPVSRTTGFSPGDQVLIKDSNNSELVRVKSVGSSSITVYDDLSLTNDYDAGTTVRATRFFRVVSVRWPYQTAPYRAADLLECIRKVSS